SSARGDNILTPRREGAKLGQQTKAMRTSKMSSNRTYLAFDLGAESGRALIGRLQSDVLSVEEVHRFPNEPASYNGELHWDVARLWLEMQKALALVSSI